MKKQEIAIIIGAGPAGLTFAFELLKNTEIIPVIFEETEYIGGISRTAIHNGNRMDIGGHRFFSKDDRIMKWWTSFLPIQGEPSKDDIILNKEKPFIKNGPNPAKTDKVMLIRERVSRILFMRKFFDYPISIKPATFMNMGFANTMKAGFGYLGARVQKREEKSLEDFMINRFGKPLYEMFFEKYTEKVWGLHPKNISSAWGEQRIKSLSLTKAIIAAITKPFSEKNTDIAQKQSETSLIEQFIYPKFGPGQLWETVAEEIVKLGGQIHLNSKATGVNIENGKITSVTINNEKVEGDYFISTMPVKDLVGAMNGLSVPKNVADIANELPYRDFITVGLLVNKLNLINKTNIKTISNIIPDTWIYIQEEDVKIGRLQVFNNWSPYLVTDLENTVWLGLEYFCQENDELWAMDSKKFIAFAISELVKIGVINENTVLDSVQLRIKKAYPAYFGSYSSFPLVQEFLDTIPNLYCIGRNGQHRYNNMDHSMLTAMEAVDNIKNGIADKNNIWNVNTESEYHETAKK